MRSMWLVAALFGAGWVQQAPAATRVLEGFDDARRWRLQVSEGASGRLQSAAGADGGRAQCLQLEFGDHAGSAQLTAELPLALPAHARLELSSRGQAAQADLALEVVDGQQRRWGSHLPGRALGARWQTLAWYLADATDAEGRSLPLPARATQLRLRVASASGGSVHWCLDQLRLVDDRPDDAPLTATALADTATALQQRMVDGRGDTFWVSSGVKQQTVSLDLGRPRQIGGLVVQWAAGMRADRYRVQGSLDGRRWEALRRVDGASGTTDRLRLGPLQARYLRLDLEDGPNWRYGIVELAPQPAAVGRSTLAWLAELGRHLPAGVLPASIQGGPQAWTVLAAGSATAPAWFSAAGIVEPRPGQYSIEPQLQVDGNWYAGHELQATAAAAPGAARTVLSHGLAGLEVLATPGTDASGNGWLRLRYRLHNPDRSEHRYALALAVRPFQLHPAGRYGDLPGGAGWIERIAVDDGRVQVNDRLALVAGQAPDAAFASHVDAGLDLALLRAARWPETTRAEDAQGLGSGVLVWRRNLAGGASVEWEAWVPLSDPAPGLRLPAGFQARPLAGEGLLLPGEHGRQLAAVWSAALQRMRDERNGPWLRADSRRAIGARNRDGLAIAAALTLADQGDAVMPWLLARIRSGSTARCDVLLDWAGPAAALQAAGQWSAGDLAALAPWLAQAMGRLQPSGACAVDAPQRAALAATALASLLPAAELAPAVAGEPSVAQTPPAAADATPGTEPAAGIADAGEGAAAVTGTVVPVPGHALGDAGRQQRWQAALATLEPGLLPGWQRWVRGQSAGLVDARQAAGQVQAIAGLLVAEGEDYLQLLPGLPASAWGGEVLQVPGLLTRWGRVGLGARREGRDWVLTLAPGMALPPAGLVIEWPFPQPAGEVTVDGVAAGWQDGRLHLRQLPGQVRITLPPGH